MPLKWSIGFKKLDLKYTWAISRNSSDFKVNAYIKINDGNICVAGEAAPNVRYKESSELFSELFSKLEFPDFKDTRAFEKWLTNQSLPNALRFGIESAFIHYMSKLNSCSVADYLGLKEPEIKNTAYTVPIMPVESLGTYINEYNLKRFKYIKIKVDRYNMVPLVTETRKHICNSIMIDANEAYDNPDEFLKDLSMIKRMNIEFIEQPFPSGFFAEYEYLKPVCPLPVFADESITNEADFRILKKGFHGVNIKLMKAGGYFNGVKLLKEARRYGLKTMIGCMIESGLGISGGYSLSSLSDYLDLDSFMILKEDPYPYILEKDGTLFRQDKANEPEFL